MTAPTAMAGTVHANPRATVRLSTGCVISRDVGTDRAALGMGRTTLIFDGFVVVGDDEIGPDLIAPRRLA